MAARNHHETDGRGNGRRWTAQEADAEPARRDQRRAVSERDDDEQVESTLATREDLADYIEVLVKKVEATRFPSISMLNRLDGLLDQLDQVEQQQELEAAQSDGGGAE